MMLGFQAGSFQPGAFVFPLLSLPDMGTAAGVYHGFQAGGWQWGVFQNSAPAEEPPPPPPPPIVVPPLVRHAEEAASPIDGVRYVACEGDVVDWVCWRHYGRTAGTVEAVLAANPGLSALGPVFSQGLAFLLPPLPEAPEAASPRVWDTEDFGTATAPVSPAEGPSRYRTTDGDLLDWLCWRHYGRTAGAVEAVLEANPGLAALGPVPPRGTVLTLPVLPALATAPVTLWS